MMQGHALNHLVFFLTMLLISTDIDFNAHEMHRHVKIKEKKKESGGKLLNLMPNEMHELELMYDDVDYEDL